MPYDNHYGVQLLDDIHNYFPAILYEPGRFRSVQELLLYVQNQTRSRFDLFSSADAAHARNAQHTHTQTALARRQTIRPREELATLIVNPQDDINAVAMRVLRDLLIHPPAEPAIPLYYTNMINPRLEPVVVRPTAEQVAASTTIGVVGDEGEMCAICQDSIAVGTDARTINSCDHSFHTNCIDAWFATNVRCPVCRHDIRDP